MVIDKYGLIRLIVAFILFTALYVVVLQPDLSIPRNVTVMFGSMMLASCGSYIGYRIINRDIPEVTEKNDA